MVAELNLRTTIKSMYFIISKSQSMSVGDSLTRSVYTIAKENPEIHLWLWILLRIYGDPHPVTPVKEFWRRCCILLQLTDCAN